jgi:hypothetical protein
VVAGTLVEQLVDGRQTNEDVNDPLNGGPAAKQQVHNVQVHAKEAAESDETPVNGTNKYQGKGNRADRTHVLHHREDGEGVGKKLRNAVTDKKTVLLISIRSYCSLKKV